MVKLVTGWLYIPYELTKYTEILKKQINWLNFTHNWEQGVAANWAVHIFIFTLEVLCNVHCVVVFYL